MEKYAGIIKTCPEIIDFFIYFSRFEFALKTKDKMRKERNGSVDACWDGFGSVYKEKLLNFPEIKESIDYLLSEPPRKRPVDGHGQWIVPNHGHEPDYKKVYKALTTIRNNLFHGDKFEFVTEPHENNRDIMLIQHSLKIMKAWTKLEGLNGLF